MSSITSNEIDIPGEDANMAIRGLENVQNEEVVQQQAEVQQYSPSARRRIEEYLESKRLAKQTMDYFIAD